MARASHVLLLLALAAALCLAGLGATRLTDRDEGANAGAAREMYERGRWLSPTLNDEPRFAKPAFTYWLMSAAFAVVGVGEAGARLPSALAATALVLLQYAFARWALGPAAGLRAALILLLSVEFVALGRMALTDALLALFTTAAGYAVFRAHHGAPPRARWYATAWVALALAALTKGPIGVLVPVLGLAAYLVVSGEWRRALREAGLHWGLPLFLLLALPWYLAMLWLHGAEYAARARGETLGRVFRTVVGPGGTALFYVPVVLLGFFPWSAFLPGALWATLRRGRARARAGRAEAASVLGATWLVAGLVLFSLVQTRLPHYVLPLLPFAALLVAATWPAVPSRLARWLLAGLGVLVAAGAAATVVAGAALPRLLAPAYPAGPGARLPGVTLVVAGLAGLLALAAGLRDGARLFTVLAALSTALLLAGFHGVLPGFDAAFVAPAADLARRAGREARSCDDLVALGPYRPSFVFYAGRPVTFVNPRNTARLAAIAERPGRRLVLLAPDTGPGPLPAAAGGLAVLEARGGYTLRAGAPVHGSCP